MTGRYIRSLHLLAFRLCGNRSEKAIIDCLVCLESCVDALKLMPSKRIQK